MIHRFEQYQAKQVVPKPVIVEDAISEDSRSSEIQIPKESNRTKKVDDTSIYEQYSLCRSFPRGNHIKHVNRQLIAMRSKNGVFVSYIPVRRHVVACLYESYFFHNSITRQ